MIAIPFMGLPGLTVATDPVGATPVGVQLVADQFREDLLLTAGEILAPHPVGLAMAQQNRSGQCYTRAGEKFGTGGSLAAPCCGLPRGRNAGTRSPICFHKAPDAVSIPIFEFLGHIMAQNATIYKVELSVSDMDRHYYETHKLTVAKHPSETDERLMVRIVAFALNAHENLEMTKGISTEDEPDIWQKSLQR